MSTPHELTPPPYLAFKTFQSAIQGLRIHGLPSELNRTAWETKSGTDQSQILGSLKFFELIDKSGLTQQALRDLVAAAENSPEEKAILNGLLRKHYEKVFALDLKNTTPKHLDDAIGEYGVNGPVKTRAVRFFLKLARHVGVDLSSRLTMKLREREPEAAESATADADAARVPESTSRRKRRPKTTPQGPVPATGSNTPSNAMKTIQLPKVGGSLSITGTFNAFELRGDERSLVYQIIDLMTDYAAKAESAA